MRALALVLATLAWPAGGLEAQSDHQRIAAHERNDHALTASVVTAWAPVLAWAPEVPSVSLAYLYREGWRASAGWGPGGMTLGVEERLSWANTRFRLGTQWQVPGAPLWSTGASWIVDPVVLSADLLWPARAGPAELVLGFTEVVNEHVSWSVSGQHNPANFALTIGVGWFDGPWSLEKGVQARAEGTDG